MADGLWLRILITVLSATQAGIAALLGFTEVLPMEWKIALVVASAALAVVLNQVPSWQRAPAAERALRGKKID